MVNKSPQPSPLKWARLLPLSLLCVLTMTGCATQSTPTPVVVAAPAIPPLPETLSKPPERSGTFLQRVTDFQQTLRDALKN